MGDKMTDLDVWMSYFNISPVEVYKQVKHLYGIDGRLKWENRVKRVVDIVILDFFCIADGKLMHKTYKDTETREQFRELVTGVIGCYRAFIENQCY